MSRKFNTKKFIKDVLNDKYALVIPLWYPFGAVKEMARCSRTLTCCLSILRSSLEAGKKLLRVWLQYVCGVKEMFLDEPSGKAEREDGLKWYAMSNTCSSADEAGFVRPRTDVLWSKPCSFSRLGVYKMPNEDFFPDYLKELYLKHSPEFSFSFFDVY